MRSKANSLEKSVAIDRGLVAIGALTDNENGIESGSAYLFGATSQNELYKLIPEYINENARFGNAIAINNGSILVGASRNDRFGQDSGSAFVFSVPDDFCPADFTDDYSLNFFDVAGFLTAYGSQDPAADINGDGSWNFFDVAEFLTSYNAGCP